ncbi:MAG: 5-(carboxyamino)imidazole ribonucleotide synthase [Pseudomonadales bacterium]|nr:5-(carboxyamino)imidazole ribonucleotide synthase [Pseudomonadales bacterium]
MSPRHHLGVFGGGQLGRMLGLAAAPLGLSCSFYEPSGAECPAALLGPILGDQKHSPEAVHAFLDSADVFTYEFENIDVGLVERIARHKPVYPGLESLRLTQNRLYEKSLFAELSIPTATWLAVNSLAELKTATSALGLPLVLKTTTQGYDGKGQFILRSTGDLMDAWQHLGTSSPLIAEQFIAFRREMSIIAVRDQQGNTATYPLTENIHLKGILSHSLTPAPEVTLSTQQTANRYIDSLLTRLNHVGVLTLELFETDNGLLANEMAPRVHNSGHWSIEGALCSQFENHVRAVLGLPLGATSCPRPTAMINLIGQIPERADILSIPGAHLHLYGKSPRPGRKLGHITLSADSHAELNQLMLDIARHLPNPMALSLRP